MSDERAGLDPDEPHTPPWFTFLGLGIFLAGGIFLLICSSNENDPASEANTAVAAPADNEAPTHEAHE